jgi:hypothetical protein
MRQIESEEQAHALYRLSNGAGADPVTAYAVRVRATTGKKGLRMTPPGRTNNPGFLLALCAARLRAASNPRASPVSS